MGNIESWIFYFIYNNMGNFDFSKDKENFFQNAIEPGGPLVKA